MDHLDFFEKPRSMLFARLEVLDNSAGELLCTNLGKKYLQDSGSVLLLSEALSFQASFSKVLSPEQIELSLHKVLVCRQVISFQRGC